MSKTATQINELSPALPLNTDPRREGSDWIRAVQTAIQGTFPPSLWDEAMSTGTTYLNTVDNHIVLTGLSQGTPTVTDVRFQLDASNGITVGNGTTELKFSTTLKIPASKPITDSGDKTRMQFTLDGETVIQGGAGIGDTKIVNFKNSAGTSKATIDGDGDFVCRQGTFGGAVGVTGAITATGNITSTSDSRVKENVNTITDALDKVDALRGVTYDRTDYVAHQIGVIAQEVELVVPEVVETHNNGMKSVAYGNLTALLIEAVKELRAEIEVLKGA